LRAGIMEAAEARNEVVQIDAEALETFAATLEADRLKRASQIRFGLPLIFDNLEQEINFFALSHLLAFGTAWHQDKPEKDEPHRDTILHGLIQLHMEGKKLDADEIGGFPLWPLGIAFQIAITKEERIDGGPIRQDVPSDWRPHIDRIHETLNRVGAELLARGFKSLADFILSDEMQGHSRPAEKLKKGDLSAALIIKRLTTCFQEFKDDEGGVAFQRKAQLMVEDLCARFRLRDPRLDLDDIAQLTLGADAETAMFLKTRGIIKFAPALEDRVGKGKSIPAGSNEEIAIRAAAASAVASIAASVAKRSEQEVTSSMVSRYIDLAAKESHLKKLKEEEKDVRADPDVRITEVFETEELPDASPVSVMHRCLDSPHY